MYPLLLAMPPADAAESHPQRVVQVGAARLRCGRAAPPTQSPRTLRVAHILSMGRSNDNLAPATRVAGLAFRQRSRFRLTRACAQICFLASLYLVHSKSWQLVQPFIEAGGLRCAGGRWGHSPLCCDSLPHRHAAITTAFRRAVRLTEHYARSSHQDAHGSLVLHSSHAGRLVSARRMRRAGPSSRTSHTPTPTSHPRRCPACCTSQVCMRPPSALACMALTDVDL
jgi:hypothetical protein